MAQSGTLGWPPCLGHQNTIAGQGEAAVTNLKAVTEPWRSLGSQGLCAQRWFHLHKSQDPTASRSGAPRGVGTCDHI